jgi:hypothetical protein
MFIPDPVIDFLPIPDRGVKKAPDPRSESATLTVTEENGNDLLPCLSHFCRAFSRAFPVALLPSVFNHSLKKDKKIILNQQDCGSRDGIHGQKTRVFCSVLFKVSATGRFYRKPYSTLVLKLHTKKFSLFMNSIL